MLNFTISFIEYIFLHQVWSHFDANQCPGPAVGVKTRMDSGINGFIHVRNLSDKKVNNPEERVKVRCQCYVVCNYWSRV